jgi:RNA 2',3'-cyclic 3'-phosphodiesterase
MSDERWRCFVAVPTPARLRAALAEASASWRSRPELAGLRWAEPASWHMTLAFLGATDPDRVPAITAAIAQAAAQHRPWRAATGGLGGFPSAGRARVAWYRVADPDRALASLAAAVRAAMEIDQPSSFRPHITLARARREPVDLRAWIAEGIAPAGHLPVHRVQLVRSHLGHGPPRYETLATATLGAPPP